MSRVKDWVNCEHTRGRKSDRPYVVDGLEIHADRHPLQAARNPRAMIKLCCIKTMGVGYSGLTTNKLVRRLNVNVIRNY